MLSSRAIGLLDTYQDLLLQEVEPNATTLMLAALGYASLVSGGRGVTVVVVDFRKERSECTTCLLVQGTEDGFQQVKLLCLRSWLLRPKTGSRAFRFAATCLVNKVLKLCM